MPKPQLKSVDPTVQAVHDMWHTVCLLLMRHFKRTEVVITLQDFLDLEPNSQTVWIQESGDTMHLKIISVEEAQKIIIEQQRKDAETKRDMRGV